MAPRVPEPRVLSVRILLTRTEQAELRRRAAESGLNVSDFVRRQTLGERRTTARVELSDLLREQSERELRARVDRVLSALLDR